MFLGEGKVYYRGENKMSHEDMVISAWEFLNEADVVEHFNGDSFDIPVLNAEFFRLGLKPPAPFRSNDYYKVVRKNFRLISRKLKHVLATLELAGKEKTGGLALWRGCLEGDPKAWAVFEKYVKRDVTALRDLRPHLLPWFPAAFNANVFLGTDDACSKCGAAPENLVKEGFKYTSTGKYQRFSCRSCGGWSASGRRVGGASVRGA